MTKTLDLADLLQAGRFPHDLFGAEYVEDFGAPPSEPEPASEQHARWRMDERRGLFAVDHGSDGTTEKKVCGPLRVVAQARNQEGTGWGYLLEARNDDREWVPIHIPRAVLFATETKGAFDVLCDAGLWMPPPIKDTVQAICQYVRDVARDKPRARIVTSAGWQQDGKVYVAANREQWPKPGPKEEIYLLENQRLGAHSLSQQGTLDGWRTEVAARCSGNSRLVFSVAAAFAGALLRDAGMPSGGFHLVGTSSEGKTSALQCAGSVYGYPDSKGDGERRPFLQTWSSTANAIAAIAARHSDGLMALDELGQADAKTVGSTVYALANGREKEALTRARELRGGGASWRLIFLSSGEKDLEVAIEEGGKVAKAGQDARLPSIPADAGAGHGLFEQLHGAAHGAEFAETLERMTKLHHGHALYAWIAHLTKVAPEKRQAYVRQRIDAFRAELTEEIGDSVAGEVHRVLARFALVAAAGELATQAGITGWAEGETSAAVKICFRAWLARRGGAGSKDKARLLSHVRELFELHLSSRFENKDGGGLLGSGAIGARDRLGFVDGDRKVALVLSETFRTQFVKGFAESVGTAAQWLADEGWLVVQQGDAKHPMQTRARLRALGNDPKSPAKGRRAWAYVFDLRRIVGPSGDTHEGPHSFGDLLDES